MMFSTWLVLWVWSFFWLYPLSQICSFWPAQQSRMVDLFKVAIHCQSLVCAASLQNQYQAKVKPLVTSKALIPKWKNNNEIKIVILGDNLQALIPWSQTLCPTSFPKFVRLPPTGSIKACLGRWNRSEITQYTNAKKQWEIWPKIKVSSSLYDNEL